MTLKIFPFEHLPAVLKMLQFSYRLLEFSSFFFAFVVAVNVKMIIKKIKYTDIVWITIVLILLTIPLTVHLQYTNNLEENRLIETVPVTSNTGRVHAGCASFEYLPSKAFQNRDYIETRNNEVIVLEGKMEIIQQKKENTNLEVRISNVEQETKIELPYIYYLGYQAMIKQGEEEIKLETYETENGFVGVKLPELKEGKIIVKYEGTNIMKISKMLSLIGVGMVIVRYIRNLKIKKRRFQN